LKEFEMSLGRKYDDAELKDIIKEKEAAGYHIMSASQAERFYKAERAKFLEAEKLKDRNKIKSLLEKKGFI
jgi:transcriptional regulator of heat shock response